MDNNEITKEIETVSVGTTKTFDKAQSDDASLYAFAGGEECVCELIRHPSAECAAEMRRIKWRSFKNTRFVVYSMFFVILIVFAVYYSVTKVYYIATLAGMVGAFMLYIVLRGERFFVSGMSFDENADENASLSVKFCADNIYVFDGELLVVAEYSQVTQFKTTQKYIYLKLKGVKPYADGMLFPKNAVGEEQFASLLALLSTLKEQ